MRWEPGALPVRVTAGRRLGIDLEQVNGDGTWRLPVPARFVIDRQGIIRAVDADPDYTRRSEPARTVEILKELSRATG